MGEAEAPYVVVEGFAFAGGFVEVEPRCAPVGFFG